MAWEHRGSAAGQYYYRAARKPGGRVVREYIGKQGSPLAELVASQDARRHADRQARREADRAQHTELAETASWLQQLCALAEIMSGAAFCTAGFHKHGGEWRYASQHQGSD